MTAHRHNKLLGQNFLTCEWVLSDLAKAAELTASDTVLEIGPGTGVLTRFLAARVKKVVAVEKDRQLSSSLSEAFAQEKISNVEIITGDILKLLPHLIADYSLPTLGYKLVSNIPYYLTSRLIRTLLELEKKPEVIVLTIQKEVAERIVARPPDMNILALSVQAYGTPEIVADVPASCFNPQPKVDSAILKITHISENFFTKHHIASKDFFSLVKAGFSSRRKMLTNNLRSFASKKELVQALHSIGHSPSARAQELSLQEWIKIIVNLRLL
ncbi:MAG: ribosomal RNA small subunit methyltransferase A [Candidatus Sungbacteria bacterium]|nr:ribosomal RNA small subunit methyltransferase A [Candidatus Sungbacteria bacterium]